jgi:hypothetical protein
MTQPVQTDPTPTPPAGATPPAPAPTTDTAPPATPPAEDKPLGPAGQKALAEEREARKALEKQVAALAPLAKLAEALGVDPAAKPGKSEVEALAERVSAQERRAADAELRALRLEVAAEKGLTPAQAARLQGASRDELTADADALKALFPAAPGTPVPTGTPAPDPSQGSRGNANELQALIAEAQKKGDVREVIRLKTALAEQRKIK